MSGVLSKRKGILRIGDTKQGHMEDPTNHGEGVSSSAAAASCRRLPYQDGRMHMIRVD